MLKRVAKYKYMQKVIPTVPLMTKKLYILIKVFGKWRKAGKRNHPLSHYPEFVYFVPNQGQSPQF